MKSFQILLPLIFLVAIPAISQTTDPDWYSEKPNMPYIQVPPGSQPKSPSYRVDGTKFNIRQVNVDPDNMNIIGDAANEPSITIDPVNPLRIAIGWRQFASISSDFREAGYAFTSDGGELWNYTGPLNAGQFRSDPVLDTDEDGNFFYNSLSMIGGSFFCRVFKSEAGSDTWDVGVSAGGGDKQWMVIDRTGGPTNDNIYSCWRSSISSCGGAFIRSLNGGQSYGSCSTLPVDPGRGTMAIGLSGEVFIVAGGLNDGGFKLMKSDNAGDMSGAPVWDSVISVDMMGNHALYSGPNPSGMLGQPWIAVDHSNQLTRGFIYIVAPVLNSQTGDPSDITFSRSTDNGLTWSAPLRLTDDAPGNYQWFPSMSVAPTGRIDVTWLDTRDNPGAFLSRLYYMYSMDGGLIWSAAEVLSESFDPHLGFPQQNKIGDYYHQISDSTGVHLAWAATFNGEEDVYYSHIQPDLGPAVSTGADLQQQGFSAAVWPAAFNNQTAFHYQTGKEAKVRLDIYNAQGQWIATPLNQIAGIGEHVLNWSPDIPAGIYFYRFSADGNVFAKGKIMKM